MRTLLIAVLILIPSLATAVEVPYSGQLSEDGNLVTGNRYVQLAVYNVASGGTPIHAQAESLTVVGGVYRAVLVVPDGTWFGGDRWIGASINGGIELSPRVKYYAPPRPSPQLFTRSPISKYVDGNQWVVIDSVNVTVPVNGFTSINVTGFAQWTAGSSVSMQVAISEMTPDELQTVINSPGTSVPMTTALMTATTAGAHTYYLSAKVLLVGSQYLVYTKHFRALFIPN